MVMTVCISACVLAVNLCTLHDFHVSPCLCTTVRATACACMCHHKWASMLEDHLMGFIRDARHTKAKTRTACEPHANTKNTDYNPYGSQPFSGEGTFSTTPLSSIHKAFNSTQCASNVCCNANRIFKRTYIPHACKQKVMSLMLSSTGEQSQGKGVAFMPSHGAILNYDPLVSYVRIQHINLLTKTP